MKIKEILVKLAAGTELSDDEKSFLESYEEPNLEAAVNAKGKKERLKLEKQIAEQAEAMEEMRAAAEEAAANSGASEIEKMQKMVEKLSGKFEAATAALESEKQAHAGTMRSNALKGINVPWVSSVPGAYRDSVMNDAFSGIDTEDLMDSDVTKPIIATIMENQASFIQASVKSGAGVSVKEKAGVSGSGDKLTAENVGDLKGQNLLDNIDAAFEVANTAA